VLVGVVLCFVGGRGFGWGLGEWGGVAWGWLVGVFRAWWVVTVSGMFCVRGGSWWVVGRVRGDCCFWLGLCGGGDFCGVGGRGVVEFGGVLWVCEIWGAVKLGA